MNLTVDEKLFKKTTEKPVVKKVKRIDAMDIEAPVPVLIPKKPRDVI